MVHIPQQKFDAVFPELNELINPSRMLRYFREQLLFPEVRKQYHITGIHIDRFLYRPGKKCRILYRVQLQKDGEEQDFPQILVCDVLPVGKEPAGRKKERPWYQPLPYMPATRFFPELHLFCVAFPNDARLPQLSRVVKEEYWRGIFRQRFPEWKIARIHSEIVKYVPGDRCVQRHTIEFQTPDSTPRRFYSKTFSESPQVVYRAMEAIWQQWEIKKPSVFLPRPLVLDEETFTIVLSEVPGQKLTEHFAEIPPEEASRQAAELLALIHTAPVSKLPAWSLQEEVEDFQKALGIISDWDASLRPELETIARKLQQLLPPPAARSVPIHGAFRSTQMLEWQGKLGLLDFDGLLLGDPLYDVGSYLSHLLYLTIKEEIQFEDAQKAMHTFLSHYQEATGWPLEQPRLLYFTASNLIGKHGKKMVKRAKKNSAQKIRRMINLANELLDSPQILYSGE